MRKLVFILALFFFTASAAFASENYTYYLTPKSSYTLFCTKTFNDISVQNNGSINFDIVADIMNSKSVFTIYAQQPGKATITLSTKEGKITYNLIVDASIENEIYDDQFFKIDKPPLDVTPNTLSNTPNNEGANIK